MPQEDEIILRLHNKYGNKWNKIARWLRGRTALQVRVRVNKSLKRQASRMTELVPEIKNEENKIELSKSTPN